eukprot:1972204-Prymnesium_polylepis.1
MACDSQMCRANKMQQPTRNQAYIRSDMTLTAVDGKIRSDRIAGSVEGLRAGPAPSVGKLILSPRDALNISRVLFRSY